MLSRFNLQGEGLLLALTEHCPQCYCFNDNDNDNDNNINNDNDNDNDINEYANVNVNFNVNVNVDCIPKPYLLLKCNKFCIPFTCFFNFVNVFKYLNKTKNREIPLI